MIPRDRHEQLSPEVVRLLHRLAGGLGVLAGVLFLIAFALGIAREGELRWYLPVLAVIFLASPLALRRLMPL